MSPLVACTAGRPSCLPQIRGQNQFSVFGPEKHTFQGRVTRRRNDPGDVRLSLNYWTFVLQENWAIVTFDNRTVGHLDWAFAIV